MAGQGTIYRLTNSGDTEGSVGTAEKIEFNTGAAAPDTTGRINTVGFRSTRDVAFHPNPRRALDKIQDNLLGTKLVTVTGYFKDHLTTAGPTNLNTWQNEPSITTDFPFGRFGLTLGNFANGVLTLVPTATKGYHLWDVDVQEVTSPRNQIQFTAWLYRDGDPT